ncbi:MAG: indole-3-glycerol phosphate synthase TrpC [Gemmatimonadota bacterium]
MSVLERIVAAKREEVERLKARAASLRSAAEAAGEGRGLSTALAGGAGEVALIAEVKRRSPSAGELRSELSPAEVARAYEAAGAVAISVLTDGPFFGGTLEDLAAVRASVGLPVLRKDFVLAPLQLWEARAAGADAVLLIVRILDDARLAELVALAGELGLDALVEVHDRAELDRALEAGARILGINNRDLSTFRTDLSVTLELAGSVPRDRVLVAESGIRVPADVDRLGAAGVDAILVGESLMRSDDVEAAARSLVGRARTPRPSRRGGGAGVEGGIRVEDGAGAGGVEEVS